MKKSKFSESQIVAIMKEGEAGFAAGGGLHRAGVHKTKGRRIRPAF
jgi:hypothetical protein